MEVCLEPSAAHAYRVFYSGLVIHNKVLGYNMDNLLPNINRDIMHILCQFEDIITAYLILN